MAYSREQKHIAREQAPLFDGFYDEERVNEFQERRKAEKRAEYQRNREKYRAYGKRRYTLTADEQKRKAREWVEQNRERRVAYLDQYRERRRYLYAENAEAERARLREWRQANPEKYRAQKARRRGVEYTDAEYVAILLSDPCAYCGAPAGCIDHIVPVSLGGDGEADNLTAACRSCNSRKHTKSMLGFMLREAS